MPYNKTTWVDRDVQFPKRYTKSNETATQVTLNADAGIVTQEGTPVNATNLNKMEQGIFDADQAAAAAQTTANGKVSKAGDTMTGALTLSGNPTATNHAATKGYVDTQDASLQTQITSLGTSKADKTYVDSQDALKVNKAGDTMTGALVLSADPTVTLGASTKGYVDDQVGTRVSKAGDTMTGALTLSGNPTATNHAATKGYVDTQITNLVNGSPAALDTLNELATALGNDANFSTTVTNSIATKAPINNPTFTGSVTLPANPTTNLGAATKGYVDTQDALKVNKAGDTMTGALVLNADPTATLGAATKGYVDTQDATKVSKAGDTLTGALILNANPTVALEAATKSYVDTSADSKVNKAGDTMTGALVLSADPTVALGAATKSYVDNILTNLPNSSITTAKLADGAVTAAKLDPTLTTTVGLGVLQAQVDGKLNKSGGVMTGTLETPDILVDNGITTYDLTATNTIYAYEGISAGVSIGAPYGNFGSVEVSSSLYTPNIRNVTPLNPVDFVIDDVTVMRVGSGGNVGIGTTIPNAKLHVNGNAIVATPTATNHAATKGYVDTQDALKINKAGDTMTGALVLNADPTIALGAATKQYVDNVSVGSVIYEYKNIGGAL